MSNRASREGTKARTEDKTGFHNRAGGYPCTQKEFIQQPVGQFDQCHSTFVPQVVAQMIVAEKMQQPVALFPAVRAWGQP